MHMESTASTNSLSIACQETAKVIHPSTSCIIKRSMDICGSLIGLLVLIVIYVPVAISIKLDSSGSVFYVQERRGLQGRPFKMWKFRSMVADADVLKELVHNEVQGNIFKNENDPRITRVGRFLRRTSLDELPQFWNVLIGEMSLVGTRPPTSDEVAQYESHHWERLNVKPGMTGQWQVSGRSSVKDFEEVVKLDLFYQQVWSPLYDIKLICQTISHLFTRSNAC